MNVSYPELYPTQNQYRPYTVPPEVVHFNPVSPVALQESFDQIKESALALEYTSTEQSSSSSRGSFRPTFVYNPISLFSPTHVHHHGEQKKQEGVGPLVRILVGVISTVGLMIASYSLGNDYTRLKESGHLKAQAKEIDHEIKGKDASFAKEAAGNISKKTKLLAKRVEQQTIKVSILPKVAIVTGCALGILGAVFNAPIVIGVGVVLTIGALAVKFFMNQANKREDQMIEKNINQVITSVQGFPMTMEQNPPSYNPEWRGQFPRSSAPQY